MKKVVLLTLIAVLLIGTSSVMAYEENVLRVGAAAWMHQKFPLEEAAQRFEEKHEGVEVEILEMQEFDQSVMLKMQRGETNYDILFPFSGGDMLKFIKLDLLEPLGDIFDNPDYQVDGKNLEEDDFLTGFLNFGYYNDNLYSLPIFGEVGMLAYRKDYFEEAGLSGAPETWEELREYAQELTTDDVYGYTTILGRGRNSLRILFSHVLGIGGEMVNDEGYYNLLAPETIEAMELLLTMYREDETIQPDAPQTFNAPRDGFKNGTVAMANFWHSWALESADVFGHDKLVLTALPGTEENGTVIYAGGAIIPKMGNVDLAKLFAVEMLQAKFFQQWSAENYYKAPVRRQNLEGLEGDYWKEMPNLVDKASIMPFYEDSPKMTDTFGRYLVRALNGDMSAEEVLEQMYEEISQMRK